MFRYLSKMYKRRTKNQRKEIVSKAKAEGKILAEGFEEEEEGGEDEEEEDECVVCRGEMDKEVVIFHCGHEFCGKCVKMILRSGNNLYLFYIMHYNLSLIRILSSPQFLFFIFLIPLHPPLSSSAPRYTTFIRCPTCRSEVDKKEITYIKTNPPKPPPPLSPPPLPPTSPPPSSSSSSSPSLPSSSSSSLLAPIVGSWGTKIDAVVRSILDTLKEDFSAKILLFAEWAEVLEVTEQALRSNGVGCLNLRPKGGGGGKGRGRGRGRRGRGKGEEGELVKGGMMGKGRGGGGGGGGGGMKRRGGGVMAERLRFFRESRDIPVLLLPLSVCF